MEDMEDAQSIASDFSVLPDAHEVSDAITTFLRTRK